MQYVRLGRSGLKVSRICLGSNMFGAGYVDDDRALSVIDEACERGVNFFDTADVYHSGLSEQVVGRALKGRRHEVVIGTKGYSPTGPGVNDRGLSRKHLIEAVEASLRRLDTEYIDLYSMHFWDPDTPLEETLRTLDDLVRQGKVRYIGCSNFAAWQLCKGLWISDKRGLERFESVQLAYNFSRRGVEQELFPLCEDQRVAVLPYQVLMGGVMAGVHERADEPPADSHMASLHASGARSWYWDRAHFDVLERLKAISREAGYEPTQVVLAWVMSRPAVTSVIVGASRPEQVIKNVQAVDIRLPQQVLGQLDGL